MTDYAINSTIYIQFTTRAFATGIPTQLAGTPVISVLEENNATPITAGITLNVDRATVTGLNEVAIVATSGNGYESGKEYAAYISTGTVGGVPVVGEVIGRFSIEKSASFARLGAAGAGLTALATQASVDAIDNFLDTEIAKLLETVYGLGAVWISTGAGAAGTTNYVHGTMLNPNSSMANSRTIANALNITRFMVLNGSSITLDQGYSNFTFLGEEWTLALANRLITNSSFIGATISGVSTGTGWTFQRCHIGAISIEAGSLEDCYLTSTITLTATGNYVFTRCVGHTVAGVDAVLDFGAAVGVTTVGIRDYHGGLEVRNMQAGDVLTFIGSGRLTIAASCTAGTVLIAGNVNLVNNGSGQTITDTARFNENQNIGLDWSNITNPTTAQGLSGTTIKAVTDGVAVAAGGIGAGAHAAAELNAIADAFLDRNMATGTDSGTNTTVTRTVRQALRILRNKRNVAAGVLTVTKENDVATSWTAAVTTAAGDPTDSIDPT